MRTALRGYPKWQYLHPTAQRLMSIIGRRQIFGATIAPKPAPLLGHFQSVQCKHRSKLTTSPFPTKNGREQEREQSGEHITISLLST
jgi:hypothetical protein